MSEIAAQFAQISRVKPIWRRAGVLVAGLIVTLAVVAMFAKIVIARVPQQRAAIEQALRQHTGLDIRFASMHVGWGFRGAQAELSDVRIADPQAARFRATAPLVRVTFDSWGLFRGGELALGRVTLVSPVIDIDVASLEQARLPNAALATNHSHTQPAQSALERDALAQLARALRALPAGRLELEAATLRLKGAEQFSNGLLQITRAVVRRDADSASAYATVLLPAELGKMAFVSVEARGLFSRGAAFDADARIITRQLQLAGIAPGRRVDGFATVDARAHVVRGVLADANWQVNLRRMAVFDRAVDRVPLRFERADFDGSIRRVADRWQVAIENLHVAPAEGAGRSAEFALDASADGAAGALTSTEVPLPVLQFLLAMGSRADQYVWPRELAADTGVLRDVQFSWDTRGASGARTTLNARVEQGAVHLADAGLQLESVRGRLHGAAGKWRFDFAPDAAVTVVRTAHDTSVGVARMDGAVIVEQQPHGVTIRAEEVHATSGALEVRLNGHIESQPGGIVQLQAELKKWDALAARQYLVDVVPNAALTAALEPLQAGRLEAARATLSGNRNEDGALIGTHSKLVVSADIAAVTWALRGRDEPLVGAAVRIQHEAGKTRGSITGGRVGDIQVVSADVAIEPNTAVRVRANALASLDSESLRDALPELARLQASGDALLELQLSMPLDPQQPVAWRSTARVSDANLMLARGLPAIENVRGTVTFADGDLQRSTLSGEWLGGDVRVQSPVRSTRTLRARSLDSRQLVLRGVASAAELARWAGVEDVRALTGDVAWTGTLDWHSQRTEGALVIESSLAGLSSTLPEPFAKRAARAVPVIARIQFDATGVRNFDVHANRKAVARGDVRDQTLDARFDIAGIEGSVVGATPGHHWKVAVDSLRVEQVPLLLSLANAAARAPTPIAFDLSAAQLRSSERNYGTLTARFSRDAKGFVLEQIAVPELYRGDAVRLACRADCQLQWQLPVNDREAMAELLGLSSTLAASDMRSTGTFTWNLESELALEAVTGRAEVELVRGSWRPGASVQRASFVDAALSPVAALKPDGTDFDRFRASVEFAADTARVTSWSMAMADGDLAARGELSIAEHRQDLELDWQPAGTLPASVNDLTSRPRLAAAWAAMRARVAGAPATTSASVPLKARLGGTWSAPVLITPDLVAQE
jgi:uncharacterized protein YhdP